MSLTLASLSTWRGAPRWKCRLCAFATTDRAVIERHLRGGGAGHAVRVAFVIPETNHEIKEKEKDNE